MFEFFDWFVQTASALVNFVFQLINGLLDLLSIIPAAVTTLTTSMGYLPAVCVGFATVTITVSVIFLIAGRSSGGEQ